MVVRIESSAEPLPGYRLLERLGRGGFGEVWKVEAPGGLPKAIKFVFNHDLPGEQRGLGDQELKALHRVKRVRHPYILSLERFDIIDDCLLIVMELADRNLWERYRECKEKGLTGIPRQELLGYMEEAAEALDLMNQTYDLQHLDIKPQNLFLMHRHVKVGDFGLVKDLEGLVAPVTGGVTPVYAAPETFEGWVSRFCDQYSLAIVYQELLTGLRPFRGTSARQLLVQHLQSAPDLAPLPESDREAIARALAKDPNQRHASCADLVRALRSASAPPPPVSLRPSGDSVSNFTADADTLHDSRRRATLTPAPPTPAPVSTLAGEAVFGKLEAAPPEITGDGSLFPALVVGLGNQGLQVLRGLRYELAERFAPEALPHLRTLFMDTDLEAIHAAYDGPSLPLQPEQTFLVKLQRPGYYLRPREWQVPYESWMPAQTLFHMTRNQTTAGIRCLGRLAFCDHYRAIAHRLRDELNACLAPEALSTAAEQTKLGVRTNRPRVYVIASLGGGTGGGMFLDLAYLLRALLRQKGYAQPDIVGVFVLPPAGTASEAALSPELGNAFAALAELHYYSQPDSTFTARYHPKDVPFRDNQAPFDRCFLLPQPERSGGREAVTDASVMAGAFLLRDLLTSVGRSADSCRATLSAAQPSSRRPMFSSFGLYRFAFPRGELIGEASRRLCHRLVERWMVKGSPGVRDSVARWIAEQMPNLQLDAETVLAQLSSAAQPADQPTAAQSLRNVLDRFAAEHSGLSVTAADIVRALDELTYIVGKPKDEGATPSAAFAIALSHVTPRLAQEHERKLNELTMSLVDRPGFRFAAAEEAILQSATLLERLLQQVDGLARRLARKATEACAQILAFADSLEKRGVWTKLKLVGGTSKLNGLLETYAKARHDWLLLQSVAAIHQTVLSGRPQLLREIGFYRHRVGELLGTFGEETEPPFEPLMAHGRYVYASEAQTLDEAAKECLDAVTPDDLLQLDQAIQETITTKFKSLVKFCLSVAHGVTELEPAIYERALAFLEPRLPAKDIAEACLRPGVTGETLQAELAEAHGQAAPPLGGDTARAAEFTVLAMPPSRAGEDFRKLATQALPDAKLTVVPSHEEIVLYRERVGVALTDLPQLGPKAHAAYRHMAALDNLTPHSRIDVDWFAPVSGSANTVHVAHPA